MVKLYLKDNNKMSLLSNTTNIIFPYITNKDILDTKTIFGQGSWIDIPSYKASWVDFGDILSVVDETVPKNFGSITSNSVRYDFITESQNVQYNEELKFDVQPNNVFNNTKTMRSAYCVFDAPTYTIDKATKVFTGLTSGSTGVILVGDIGHTEVFQISFSGNVSAISANTADFNFNIYKYYETNSNFLKPELIRETIEHGLFETSLVTYVNLDLTNYVDNEYLIKGGYTYDNCTPGAKLLGLRTNTLNFINPLVGYVDYNSTKDWYFVYTLSALTPQVQYLQSLSQTSGVFNVESLAVKSPGFTGVTYNLTQAASGDYLVHVNGVALLKGVEYISSTNYFTMLVPLSSTDILTIAYVAGDNGTSSLISSESYVVPNSIPNTTTPSVGQKLIYNTTTNKYEYWLDSEPSANVVFLRNGLQLTTGEYMISSSNKRRIILSYTPAYNDLIEVFYASLVSSTQNIGNKDINIIFSIPIAPTKVNGHFVINFYDKTDTSLTTPLFSETIDYIVGQNVYSTTITVPTTYTAGQEFLWQITNTKNFDLIFGSGTITTVAKSSVYNAIMTTNENNNY